MPNERYVYVCIYRYHWSFPITNSPVIHNMPNGLLSEQIALP